MRPRFRASSLRADTSRSQGTLCCTPKTACTAILVVLLQQASCSPHAAAIRLDLPDEIANPALWLDNAASSTLDDQLKPGLPKALHQEIQTHHVGGCQPALDLSCLDAAFKLGGSASRRSLIEEDASPGQQTAGRDRGHSTRTSRAHSRPGSGPSGGGRRRQQQAPEPTAPATYTNDAMGNSSKGDIGRNGKRQMVADGVSRLDASLTAEMEKAQQMQSGRRPLPSGSADASDQQPSSETIAGTPAGSAATGDEDLQSLTDKIHIHRGVEEDVDDIVTSSSGTSNIEDSRSNNFEDLADDKYQGLETSKNFNVLNGSNSGELAEGGDSEAMLGSTIAELAEYSLASSGMNPADLKLSTKSKGGVRASNASAEEGEGDSLQEPHLEAVSLDSRRSMSSKQTSKGNDGSRSSGAEGQEGREALSDDRFKSNTPKTGSQAGHSSTGSSKAGSRNAPSTQGKSSGRVSNSKGQGTAKISGSESSAVPGRIAAEGSRGSAQSETRDSRSDDSSYESRDAAFGSDNQHQTEALVAKATRRLKQLELHALNSDAALLSRHSAGSELSQPGRQLTERHDTSSDASPSAEQARSDLTETHHDRKPEPALSHAHSHPSAKPEHEVERSGSKVHKVSQMGLHESGFECRWEGSEYEEAHPELLTPESNHTACRYRNLLLWNDQVYFVSSNSTQPRIPRVRMSVENSSWAQTLDIQVVSPTKLPEKWHTKAPQKALQAVIFWHMSHYGDVGRTLGEDGPNMHILACTMLGYCAKNMAEHMRQLNVIYTNNPWEGRWPGPAADVAKCFSHSSPSRLGAPAEEYKDQLVLIKHAAAGIGPKCRSSEFCREEFGAGPPASHEMESWQERVSTCFGVPSISRIDAMPKPWIGVVDHVGGSSDSIHDVNAVMGMLRSELGGHEHLEIKHLDLSSNTSIREQAQLFDHMAVAIQVGGNDHGSWIFMPHGAAVVELLREGANTQMQSSIRMAQDLSFMGLIYEPVAEQPSHVASAATATWEYQNLTALEKQAFQRGDCPRESHELWCEKWRGHSSLQVRIPDLQTAVHLALKKVGISVTRNSSPQSPSASPSPLTSSESSSHTSISSPSTARSASLRAPESSSSPASHSQSPSASQFQSAVDSSSAVATPASSSATGDAARNSAAATSDVDAKSSSKEGVMLESASGPVNSKVADTVASEW
ncbi:hypothetical protein WJX74_005958 [Apatococcus lobatus]|uniref:Uncharacterized protein n=1 Tax=Apatococcus lobatus TaxID=904363 RepID=A0AAW1REZ6_9CHLO